MDQVFHVSSFSRPPYLMPCFELPLIISLRSPGVNPRCRNPGFLIELMFELLSSASAQLSNYSFINFQKSTGFGSRLPNGQWTGMIGDIASNRSEAALPILVSSPDRSKVVHFIDEQPLFSLEFCFMTNPAYVAEIRVDSCLDRWSWGGLIMVYVLLLGTLMLQCIVRKRSVSEMFDDIYNISFRQDIHDLSNLSGSVLTVLWSHCVGRLLFVLFASALYYQTQRPISLLRYLSDMPLFLTRYKLFVPKSSLFYDELVASDVEQFVQIRTAVVGSNNFVPFQDRTPADVITAGKNRQVFTDCSNAKIIAGQNPEVLVSRMHSRLSPVSVALNKQVPESLKQHLADKSSQLREHGMVKRLANKYFGFDFARKKSLYSFTTGTFSTLFVLYLSLCGACVAGLLVELVIKRGTVTLWNRRNG